MVRELALLASAWRAGFVDFRIGWCRELIPKVSRCQLPVRDMEF